MEAPKIFYPGEKIHYEEPFVYVLRRSLKDTMCEACFKIIPNLKACKACMRVKYCDKKCQEKNWKDHKLECRHLKNLQEHANADYVDFVRLLGKIILKLKGKSWSSVQKRVLINTASFQDLDSRIETIKSSPHLLLFCKELKELTRKFIGDENMPNDNDFMEIVGKVKHNAIRNSVLEEGFTGIFLYLGVSKFEHSCIPNANIDVSDTTLKIWAIRKIKKKSENITVSFRRRVCSSRLLIFEEKDKVDNCKCKDCLLPYGESTLTKILDDKKAFSVIDATERFLGLNGLLSRLPIPGISDEIISQLMYQQEGVLGRTNILRLRLLAVRCFMFGGHLLEITSTFCELEERMSSVFGAYSLEMVIIYENMMQLSFDVKNPILAVHCAEKLQKLHMHRIEQFRP